MCGLKAAQLHEWPFRAGKELLHPSAALDPFLPNGKKILISRHLSSVHVCLGSSDEILTRNQIFLP